MITLVNLKVDQLARELVKMFIAKLIKKDKMTKETQVKVKVSDKYYKDRDNLERFLFQYNLYIWHNQEQFKKTNKIIFTVIYIRDKVF